MNKNTFEKLQYNELKDIIKSYCVSGLGKELIDKLEPSSNLKVVKKRLDETSEGRNILSISSYIPLDGISNIKSLINNLEKGLILEPQELVAVGDFLRGCRKIKSFMEKKSDYAKTLSEYSNLITILPNIEEEIENSIKGSLVESNASKELKRIRRHMENCEEKINQKLEKFLKSSANKKYIQEFFISKRNDRFTIPIKASYKNQVEGTVVEVSSKGSTVFIEPASISKHTLELAVLKSEESIEEYRILSELTNLVFEKVKEIKINIDVIAEYDMIFAKAKYSKSIEGIKPKLNNHGYIKINNGKHPLLKGNVVPLDFEIGKNYRSLIITGPNAGGKTVVLKNVGLISLAVQSGFHINAKEGSEISIFEKIFVDIGDNQSIENSLSTFSSHMKNLSEIINSCNKSTLILCDEIGSGTEPNEGAGLAIAILEEFYKRGCITVATTHYGEIKNFSENHEDFENSAMQFESDTLEPLYKLLIGKTGESNALWISRKMGINEKILERARGYIENRNYNFEKLNENKVRKSQLECEEIKIETIDFNIGDRVRLLDFNEVGIVYKPKDKYNILTILYKNEFIEVSARRVLLEIKAEELYPKDYDMDSLFIDFKERKLEKDIKRGSKKALKNIQKEIRKNKA
ncbi:endonuclease MutS2 [Clostridium sp. LIBA-8841]|uniref:endonuclease MutS2 n=1 Tax=Clostridium sp. LIBA-8841 TaxID=2987530 RepID=UPI002AC5ECD6|nr:endonuclease MutS2 [Clostridium sp. LIBA-8841]MDZ5253471.1 endonuclease MutS2 [Clostridium sp. LIBA-8841]